MVDVDKIEETKAEKAKKARRFYRPAVGITAYNTQLVNFINETRLDIIQGIKTVIEPNKIIEAEGSYIQGMILMDPDFGHSWDYCKYFMIQKSDQGFRILVILHLGMKEVPTIEDKKGLFQYNLSFVKSFNEDKLTKLFDRAKLSVKKLYEKHKKYMKYFHPIQMGHLSNDFDKYPIGL